MDFPLHTYMKGIPEGANPAYRAALIERAKLLSFRRLPVLLTPGSLSFITGVPYNDLNDYVSRAVDPYRFFKISKRKGGFRTVCVAERNLYKLQYWINKNILLSEYSLATISHHATAYLPKSSHLSNASQHLGANWVYKVDISNFFESISERQVYRVFRNFGYSKFVSFCLARICTRVLFFSDDVRRKIKRWRVNRSYDALQNSVMGHLPQGASTSPMLSNLVCNDVDKTLSEMAMENDLIYTRYADDIVFSGSHPFDKLNSISKSIRRVLSQKGFRQNTQKTRKHKHGQRMIITGLCVNDTKLHVPRSYKDKLRQELYYIKKYSLENHCKKVGIQNPHIYLLRLDGKISYIQKVEPEKGALLRRQFNELFPQINEYRDYFK